MAITTVDNFNSSICNGSNKINTNGFEFALDENNKYSFISTTYVNDMHISLKKYKENQNKLFSLIGLDNKKDDDFILSVSSYVDINENKIYTTQTGNYIGKFIYNKENIDIKSRFSDVFLKRMLNFANDVYLDDVSVFEAKEDKKSDLDYAKFIIYYIFIQKLEKAFLLGLPKAYRSIEHHEMMLKGKIDINRFIKYDIPFKGKVSSVNREQKEIQEIIDVLYKAISIIEKDKNEFCLKNVSYIKTHLKQHCSNKYVSNETLSKAIKSKALQNPIFAPYKKVLEYAKLIIDSSNLEENKDGKENTFGFLVNVSELFEIYIVKLLQYKMPGWNVIHEDPLNVYPNNFYNRHMYPDIVMKKDKKVMVFDVKYKRMTFQEGIGDGNYGDLDRSDFFQINTYIAYYNNQKDIKLIAGGLFYPIEKEFNKSKAYSDDWIGNTDIKFIVDGIDLTSKNKELTSDDIKKSEDSFIERIKIISGEYK